MNAPQLRVLALAIVFLAASETFAATASQELLSEAQTAYLRGDTVAAKAKFESVVKLEPKNETALGYLRVIRAKEEKENKHGSQEKQLAGLIVPAVQFREASLSASLDFLKQQVAKLSEGKQSVNFVLQVPDEVAKANSVSLNLNNVPFTEVLKYVGSLANVRFVYDKYAILVQPAGAGASAQVAPAGKAQ
ncbi:MAG TPA: hypothetical protein VF593_11270 [Chthoniobacteraceae bacterium]|jgi:hypothetical protein